MTFNHLLDTNISNSAADVSDLNNKQQVIEMMIKTKSKYDCVEDTTGAEIKCPYNAVLFALHNGQSRNLDLNNGILKFYTTLTLPTFYSTWWKLEKRTIAIFVMFMIL